ncbi:MAG: ABC transporter substrate-binding protein [Hyphomicrobiales bacterium]|nr:ABC transporter substrate-binding protein [Hyphomicrobiales bacterium]
MESRLPRWLRISVLVGCVLLAIGIGLSVQRYVTRPVSFTIAAGAVDSELTRMMGAIASRLTATRSHIRLKVVEKETAIESARAFAKGEVDLAIVRGDLVDTSAARSVVVVGYSVVLIVVPLDSEINSMDDLEGKSVGVVEGEINRRVVDALIKEYDLGDAHVHFQNIDAADANQALQSRKVSALLVVMPVTERYLTVLRELFPRGHKLASSKSGLKLLPIEAAGAMAAMSKSYQSFELPKGAIRGSPPIPDDDLATLRVPYYLVANAELDDDSVADLASALLDARRDLISEYPLLGQVAAPGTAKDADIPIHPGAKAFLEGEQKTFFDKWGDQIFYGSLLLGSLTSMLAGAWRYFVVAGGPESPLDPLYALADRVRMASNEAELTAVEGEIDAILRNALNQIARGNKRSAEAAALGLAVQRLEIQINRRRAALQASEPATFG